MYLVTGANGQLGRELQIWLPNALYVGKDVLDITDGRAVQAFVRANAVELIINCAAYTAVDKAETEAALCTAVNVDGARNLAASGAKMIHISTDYVFDGHGYRPYRPEDTTNPLSVYGKTKLAGEQAVLEQAQTAVIIRTSWLYAAHGNNFVKTMRRLGAEKASVNVVADQLGTPTYAGDLAEAVVRMIPRLNDGQTAIYHYTNEGVASWYDFAHEIMSQSGLSCKVHPIPSSAYPTPAVRPFYSVLDKSKIKTDFGVEIPHWKESLKKCLKQF